MPGDGMFTYHRRFHWIIISGRSSIRDERVADNRNAWMDGWIGPPETGLYGEHGITCEGYGVLLWCHSPFRGEATLVYPIRPSCLPSPTHELLKLSVQPHNYLSCTLTDGCVMLSAIHKVTLFASHKLGQTNNSWQEVWAKCVASRLLFMRRGEQ